MKTFFVDHHQTNPLLQKPALSEHSTSNPATSSPTPAAIYTVATDHLVDANQELEGDDEEEDIDEEAHSDSEAEMGRNNDGPISAQNTSAEPSELMQLDLSEDIRLGSPDDGSNNLDSDFHLLTVTQPEYHLCQPDSYPDESTRPWLLVPDPTTNIELPLPSSGTKLVVTSETCEFLLPISAH